MPPHLNTLGQRGRACGDALKGLMKQEPGTILDVTLVSKE